MSSNLKDVAKSLNMSISTISRVVNNKNYVNPKTREKILNALKELNYTPNQAARSLKNKKTNTIGILIPDISEDFFAYVIKGIDKIFSQNGYSIILCDTGENPEKEKQYLNLLLEKQIDGIILATVCKEKDVLNEFFSLNMPIIFIDNLPNIRNNCDTVIIDNIKASYMAVNHLIELGHKNIGIITGKIDETTGYERMLGYKKALEEHCLGIHDELIRIGDFKENSGYQNMISLLDVNKDITAVYVASSKMTYGAIKAIKERKLRIPEDIALVGFDVHDISGLISPSITTITQPEEEIGKVAGELMIKRLQDGEERFHQKIVLDPGLLIRESCGYLKKSD